MEKRTLLDSVSPTTQSIEAVKSLLAYVGRASDLDGGLMSGNVAISLLFQDGDYKESGNIIIPCDKAGFKGLLESLVFESSKHVAKDTDLEKKPEFVCLECGHKFYSVHAAEKAAFGDGCPSCSGSDIEVA